MESDDAGVNNDDDDYDNTNDNYSKLHKLLLGIAVKLCSRETLVFPGR